MSVAATVKTYKTQSGSPLTHFLSPTISLSSFLPPSVAAFLGFFLSSFPFSIFLLYLSYFSFSISSFLLPFICQSTFLYFPLSISCFFLPFSIYPLSLPFPIFLPFSSFMFPFFVSSSIFPFFFSSFFPLSLFLIPLCPFLLLSQSYSLHFSSFLFLPFPPFLLLFHYLLTHPSLSFSILVLVFSPLFPLHSPFSTKTFPQIILPFV